MKNNPICPFVAAPIVILKRLKKLTTLAGCHSVVSRAGGAPRVAALQHSPRHMERRMHLRGDGDVRHAVVPRRLRDRSDIQDIPVSCVLLWW